MLRYIIQLALSSSSIDTSLFGFQQQQQQESGVRSLFGISTQTIKYNKGERILYYAPSGWLQVQSFPGVINCTNNSQQTTITAVGVCIIDDSTSSHMLVASGAENTISLQQLSFSDDTCTTQSSAQTISPLPVTSVCSIDGLTNSIQTKYFTGAIPPSFPYSGAMFSLSADNDCNAIIKQTVVNSNYCFSNGATSIEILCDSKNPYVTNIYSDSTCRANQVVTARETPSTCVPYSTIVKSNEPQYTYGSALRSCYNSTSKTTRALRGS